MTIHIVRSVPLVALSFAAMFAMFAMDAGPAHAGGGCRGNPSTFASGSQVRMTGYACFTPTVLYAEAGTTVTWTNETDDVHDVAGATLEWGDYAAIRAGGQASFRFEEPGTYPYYCFVHPGMTGAIVVGDGRTTAVSARQSVKASAIPVSEALSVPAVAGQSEEAALAAATNPATSGELRSLPFAALGALAGGVAVAVAFGAQRMRRG